MNNIFSKRKIRLSAKVLLTGLSLIFALNCVAPKIFAQGNKQTVSSTPNNSSAKTASTTAALPTVTQIDTTALQNLIKHGGENQKPLVVNFWATWCGPCVEEFPDLVKIDEDYRGKIDFITISMDDLADINTEVPKFLDKMKAKMPAYLLKTDDEEAAIVAVAKDWQGGLPFTIIYNEKGEISYSRQGKIMPDVVRKEINKVVVLANIRKKSFQQPVIDASAVVLDTKLNLLDIYSLPVNNRQYNKENLSDKISKVANIN